MADWFNVAVSMEVLVAGLRSCESCRQAPFDFIIHETMVCRSCAEVA